MLRSLPLFIGLRYTRAKRRNHFISFISGVSMIGIALGICALITVISVMNGFEKELRGRILGMVAHASITGVGGGLSEWREAVAQAKKTPHVIGAAPYVESEVMLQGPRVSAGVLRGVSPELEPEVSEISRRMKSGRWEDLKPGQFDVILGTELAMWLGVGVGDKVVLYAPMSRVTPVGAVPVTRQFTVIGIFEAGTQEFDRYLAVTHIDDAGRLFRMNQDVTGVRLKLDDMFRAFDVARELRDNLGGFYRITDWTQEHENFFRAVATEKVVMFVILSLIVAVAAFNLVSTLIMLVTDKQADIAILRTLGMKPSTVMGIFMVQGTLVGVVGIVAGVIGGLLLAQNVTEIMHGLENLLHFQLMPPEMYYISELPSDVRWPDVVKIVGIGILFSVMATVYPAWRASRTQPAEALRYE